MNAEYIVEVMVIGGWDTHSRWESYSEAVSQAVLVGGRVVLPSGMTDEDAYEWAVKNQGFTGDYEEWRRMDDDERDKYEAGAAGIPTA